MTTDIFNESEDLELKLVEQCRHRSDWRKWKDAIQVELDALAKRNVFGPIVKTLEEVNPVGYKWVFVGKCNEKNEIMRYKTQLVA